MTTSASASSSTDDNSPKPFPVKARVILHGLKAAEFNDKIGVIQQGSLNSEGRQQVHVEELNKTVALKLVNLRYQPRPVDSLSNKELKTILRHRQEVLKFQGMDKSDLQAKLEALTTDPDEIAEWLATANAGVGGGTTTTTTHSNDNNNNNSTMDQQLDNMSPEMLLQQAQMMRSMPPARIRAMNPQLAHMTDAQILQAATQMEMMATNPQAMQQMKQQMQNMTPAQKEQYRKMMNGGGGAMPTPTATQPKNPQEMLANMTPEQLKQQAQMMRSMPPDSIRAMNPQLANMTDAQIQQAATQFEMMANNPELMKMASDQMKNMTPEQMQQMMNGGGGDPSSFNPAMMGMGATTNNNNAGAAPATMDPAKMLETMDTAQIKSMMNMLKSNPEMLDQMAATSGTSKESLQKMLGMFSDMSDEQLEASLKTMAKVQKMSSTVQNAWNSTNTMVGGKLKPLLITVGIVLVVFVVLYLLGGSDNSQQDIAKKAAGKVIRETVESIPQMTPQEPAKATATESIEDEFSEL